MSERRPFAKGTVCTAEEGRTRQADLDASDINKIVKRYEMSGILPQSAAALDAAYLDLGEVVDYRSALEQVRKADEFFETLPASSRAVFHNDPAEFLDAVDKGKVKELEEAGLIPKSSVTVAGTPAVPEAKETPPVAATEAPKV